MSYHQTIPASKPCHGSRRYKNLRIRQRNIKLNSRFVYSTLDVRITELKIGEVCHIYIGHKLARIACYVISSKPLLNRSGYGSVQTDPQNFFLKICQDLYAPGSLV